MKQVDELINTVGRSVYIKEGMWQSKTYRAVIQPLRYKNKMYLNGEVNDLGHYSEGFYLYIGPASVKLSSLGISASLYTSDSKRYKIERWENIFYKEEPLYTWAVLKERL